MFNFPRLGCFLFLCLERSSVWVIPDSVLFSFVDDHGFCASFRIVPWSPFWFLSVSVPRAVPARTLAYVVFILTPFGRYIGPNSLVLLDYLSRNRWFRLGSFS